MSSISECNKDDDEYAIAVAISKQKKLLSSEHFKICVITFSTWISAISLTILNKQLLTYDALFARFPVGVLWIQSVTAIVIAIAFIFLKSFACGDLKYATFGGLIGSVNLRSALVMSVLSTISLIFTTIILKYYSIAVYTTSRTLGIVFTVIFSRLILKDCITVPIVLACGLIAAGYFSSISDKIELDNDLRFKNFVYTCCAGISISLTVVYVKKALPNKTDSAVVLLLINNIFCALSCLIFMFFKGDFEEFGNFDFKSSSIVQVAISGVLASVFAYLSRLQVQFTSPITYEIVASMRLINQAIVGVLMFKESVSAPKIAGVLLVAAGSSLYGYVKARGIIFKENASKKQEVQKEAM